MKQWLKRNWAILAAMVALAFCLFSFTGYVVVDPANNTDSSWAYSLSGLRHGTQVLGRDVFFTYGPLYERMVTNVYHQDSLINFVVSNLLFLFILAVSLYGLYRIIKLYHLNETAQGRILLLLSSLSLLVSLSAIDTLFYIILLITLLAVRREKSYPAKLLLLSGAYSFSFYKFNLAIPTLLLSLLALIELPKGRNVWRGALEWLGSLVMYLVIYFVLAASLTLSGFFNYLHFGFSNSLAYNEFMSLPYSQYPKLVLAYSLLVSGVIIIWLWRCFTILRKRQLAKSFDFVIGGLIFIVVLLFAFKHGVIRTRLSEFTAFVFPTLIFAYLIIKPQDFIKKTKIGHFGIITCAIFLFSVGIYLLSYNQLAPRAYKSNLPVATYYGSRIILLKLATIHNRLNYGYFNQEKIQAGKDLAVRAKIVENIKQQLDEKYPGRELLYYGNVTIYGDVLKQSHPVLLMPGVQNYAANPPQLFDPRYIDFLDQHPDALVFAEETEPSIDQRMPTHELNNFLQYLIHNYRVVLQDNVRRQYVFERVSSSRENCRTLSSLAFKDDSEVFMPQLPATDSHSYVKLKLIAMNSSLAAKAATALVKAPTYTLNLTNVENGTMHFRTTPSLLEHGVAISPLYLSLGDYMNGTPFRLLDFSLNDGFPRASTYQAEFELCSYIR